MRFWDSSALVPLLVRQARTPDVTAVIRKDRVQVVWWGTEVECTSAIARLERDNAFATSKGADAALARLKALHDTWHEVQPVTEIKETARRLLRVHTLGAADAIQLAAALVMAERRPSTLDFVCLDERLSRAARLEGFNCVP